MRGIINWAAFSYFVWLVIDAFHIPSMFIDFLLVGALPGTSGTVPASVMLTVIGAVAALISLEIASRHIAVMYRVRKQLSRLSERRSHLPQRRFSRI